MQAFVYFSPLPLFFLFSFCFQSAESRLSVYKRRKAASPLHAGLAGCVTVSLHSYLFLLGSLYAVYCINIGYHSDCLNLDC